MKNYIHHHEWKIIEKGFNPELNKNSESVFSIGNGRFGQRANFEEDYSGESMQGSYVAGVYYPDKTRVGWWKNGYPEYFAKVINSANWIGIKVAVDGDNVDLHHCKVSRFQRVLNMKEGYLERSFQATLESGKKIGIKSTRFCSMADDELGAIKYEVKALNFSGEITFTPYVDFDVVNEDANYDEKFWNEVDKKVSNGLAWITAQTKDNDFGVETFQVTTGMQLALTKNGEAVSFKARKRKKEKFVSNQFSVDLAEGEKTTLYKYATIVSSLNYNKESLTAACEAALERAKDSGFTKMLKEHKAIWKQKWANSDVEIKGDVSAQQGIRFNIFQLNQTYTGEDVRLNIGPKGFTGEKYGGVTYWDTEAYCLPFYLSTSPQKVAKQLLVYRYEHLQKAIENAAKLGFVKGAALYPMVTINGEECHNEWEITFEEIHRNGAIAFAIYDYIRYTNDHNYLAEKGLEVLIAIARFWSQRVNWSIKKEEYVMLGVTGPNEFENNVNNNFYTSYLAVWCLKYTMECIEYVKTNQAEAFGKLAKRIKFKEAVEVERWKDISTKMHYPYDNELDIYLQQDNFLDKEQILVKDLPKKDLPIVQNWSWDRILRSVFIKQADTLQTFYFFEEDFDMDAHRRHYDFYEPRTVHESSLSPCVHSILAAKLGYEKRAYQFYLQTSRLDLDDYNNDTEDGCHITSMAGSWMSIVKGFAGMRIENDCLTFKPFVPKQWKGYAFKIRFRDSLINVDISKRKTNITLESGHPLTVIVNGKDCEVK